MKHTVKWILDLLNLKKLKSLPWYDSEWLSHYLLVKENLKNSQNEAELKQLEDHVAVLKTREDFEIIKRDDFLTDEQIQEANEVVKKINLGDAELYELKNFGRYIIHNHPHFSKLHQLLVERVSELVGEKVEASYSFLSLYRDGAKCPLHLDAPSAKWTLDICLNQSSPWEIFFSPVMPWPESFQEFGPNWEQRIRNTHEFTSTALEVGEGVIFSGSSQWHYRNNMAVSSKNEFADFIFFHFAPVGHGKVSDRVNYLKGSE
tara:strand:- start:139106 stop:139888 length:783 start_codon:yes stop_codon:yes gene_type:complete